MWQYEFYRNATGEEPVKTFLDSLDRKARAKVFQTVGILSEFGPIVPFPYSSHVQGEIRELRAHYGKTLYRILYFHDSQGTFILLHAFEKSTAQIPVREIKIAQARIHDYLSQKKGD